MPLHMALQCLILPSAILAVLLSSSLRRSSPWLGSLVIARLSYTKGLGIRSAAAVGRFAEKLWVMFEHAAGGFFLLTSVLGIIGYGHIGSQLSVLAEAFGMTVIYHDAVNLMALGTAKQVPTLEALLRTADFVTCHVPELPETTNLVSRKELDSMKHGSYLINASRGSVIDIPALIDAMRSGKLAGAALDVYPAEPGGNGDYFTNDLNPWAEDLRSLKNIILTPHIGGSTEEAQSAIGIEVAAALVRYVNEGSTLGAVNMPEVNLRSLTMDEPNHVRVVYIHRNIPGVLRGGES